MGVSFHNLILKMLNAEAKARSKIARVDGFTNIPNAEINKDIYEQEGHQQKLKTLIQEKT